MSEPHHYATVKESYEAGKMIAGDHVKAFKRSLFLFALAYTMQGGAYLSIYGVMAALFSSPVQARYAWIWFGLMLVFVLINVCARWFAHDFEYTDTMANITHDMRSKLGKKLRTMPLEVLGRYKTGDLNSGLSSNVDESVMMLGMVSGMFIETVLTPAVVVVGMWFIDWRMAVVLMVIMPLAIPLYRRKRRSGIHEKTAVTHAGSALESDIIEYIQGLAVLRTTNQTGENAKRLHSGGYI